MEGGNEEDDDYNHFAEGRGIKVDDNDFDDVDGATDDDSIIEDLARKSEEKKTKNTKYDVLEWVA